MLLSVSHRSEVRYGEEMGRRDVQGGEEKEAADCWDSMKPFFLFFSCAGSWKSGSDLIPSHSIPFHPILSSAIQYNAIQPCPIPSLQASLM